MKHKTVQTLKKLATGAGIGLAAIILALLLVGSMSTCLTGCAGTGSPALYTTVKKPTLHHIGQGTFGDGQNIYFVVSNPTSERKHYYVTCRMNNGTAVHKQSVIVPPRSDKKVRLYLMNGIFQPGAYTCRLEHDWRPGSSR